MAAQQLVNPFAPKFVQTTQDPTADMIQAQYEAQRQQQIADALQNASMEPIQSNGAPISPLQGLAKLLQGYKGNQARQQSIELQKQQALAQARQFDQMFPGSGAPPSAASAPSGAGGPSASDLATALGAPAAASPPPNAPPPGIAANTPPIDPSAATTFPLQPIAPQAHNGQPPAPTPPQGPQGAPAPGGAAQPPQAAPPPSPQAVAAHTAASMIPSLTGDPNQDRLFAMQMGVPEYLKQVASRYAWTDQQKNDAAVGINAATRRAMDIASAYRGAVVPGASSVINVDANGNPVAQEIPGLRADTAATSAATTAATQSQTPHWGKNSSGQEVPIYSTPPAAQMPGSGIPTAGGGGAGGGGGGLQTTSGAASQQALGTSSSALADKINSDAEAALEGKRQLAQMGNLLQGFTPGAGAPVLAGIGGVAEALGVPAETVEKYTKMNTGDVEAFRQNSMQLAAAAAKATTSKVNKDLLNRFIESNPNWMMTPGGVQQAMDFMGRGFDQTLEKQQAFQNFTRDPRNDPGRWAIDFPAAYNAQTLQKIKSGAMNSAPGDLSGVRTRESPPAEQYQEGQTAGNGAYIYRNGQWVPNLPTARRPGQ